MVFKRAAVRCARTISIHLISHPIQRETAIFIAKRKSEWFSAFYLRTIKNLFWDQSWFNKREKVEERWKNREPSVLCVCWGRTRKNAGPSEFKRIENVCSCCARWWRSVKNRALALMEFTRVGVSSFVARGVVQSLFFAPDFKVDSAHMCAKCYETLAIFGSCLYKTLLRIFAIFSARRAAAVKICSFDYTFTFDIL